MEFSAVPMGLHKVVLDVVHQQYLVTAVQKMLLWLWGPRDTIAVCQVRAGSEAYDGNANDRMQIRCTRILCMPSWAKFRSPNCRNNKLITDPILVSFLQLINPETHDLSLCLPSHPNPSSPSQTKQPNPITVNNEPSMPKNKTKAATALWFFDSIP